MKVWYVVIEIFGQIVYQSPAPMTAADCADELAFRMMQILAYERSGKPPPILHGKVVSLEDVGIACKKGEMGG